MRSFFKFIFKLFKFFLMLTGIMSFNRCGSGYKKDGDKVLYNGKEVSKDLQVLNDVFAKDDTDAYYKTYSINGADVATFTALDKHYAKDKNTVYYCDEYREGQNYYLTKRQTIFPVKQAQAASFVIMGDGYAGYAKDSHRAYYQGVGFAVQDVATLEMINGRFLKDKKQVYYAQAAVKGSDPKSFRLLNEYYAQDTAHVYYYTYPNEDDKGIHVLPCNSHSFTLLNYPYSKDDVSVYFVNVPIKGVDAATFSVLENDFSKDKQSVFFKDKKIKDANAATFTVMPEYQNTTQELYYAKDNTAVFWENKKLEGVDVSSFKALDFGYAIDNHHVYHQTTIVKGADPNSFKVYPHGIGNADAEDKNHHYSEGKKVDD